MADETRRLIEIFRERSVRTGRIVLSSGKISDFYVDGKQTALHAEGGWLIGRLILERLHPEVTGVGGLIDSVASTEQLAEIEKIIPMEWRPAAVGSARECAEAWVGQFEAGVDGLIIHASTPEEFAPVLDEYRKIRPNERFENRTNRPG